MCDIVTYLPLQLSKDSINFSWCVSIIYRNLQTSYKKKQDKGILKSYVAIMEFSQLLVWIEAHPTTVQLLMWAAVLFIAWFSGLFRFLSKFKRRCTLDVISTASRCLIEEFEEYNGVNNVTRASYIIDASVVNPTNETISVESFQLYYKGQRGWVPDRKHTGLYSVTMPNRPRQLMGSAIRFSKVFFSNIIDGSEGLTMSGRLEPKEFQNGYMLFVSFTHGSWNPKIIDDQIHLKLIAKLTTGETLKDTALVPITKDKDFLEEWIPGIVEHINHEAAWSGFIKKRK